MMKIPGAAMHPARIIAAAWVLFGVVWLLASFTSHRTIERESLASRLSYVVPTILATALIFPLAWSRRLPAIDARLVAPSRVRAYAGAALTVAGIAWATWARAHIGRLWSGNITLKEGHRLVCDGPYAITRHPIYTGVLVALLGTTMAALRVRGALGFSLAVIAFAIKSRREDAWLAKNFGGEFEAYKRRVRALIPLVW